MPWPDGLERAVRDGAARCKAIAWNGIFADDTMTVAAVDRLSRQALTVEIHSGNYWKRSAAKRGEEAKVPTSKEDSSWHWHSLSEGESQLSFNRGGRILL